MYFDGDTHVWLSPLYKTQPCAQLEDVFLDRSPVPVNCVLRFNGEEQAREETVCVRNKCQKLRSMMSSSCEYSVKLWRKCKETVVNVLAKSKQNTINFLMCSNASSFFICFVLVQLLLLLFGGALIAFLTANKTEIDITFYFYFTFLLVFVACCGGSFVLLLCLRRDSDQILLVPEIKELPQPTETPVEIELVDLSGAVPPEDSPINLLNEDCQVLLGQEDHNNLAPQSSACFGNAAHSARNTDLMVTCKSTSPLRPEAKSTSPSINSEDTF